MLRALVIVILMGCFIGPATAQSYGGWTCAMVRKLSEEQRKSWIAFFGLSDATVSKIKRRCKIK